MATGAVQRPPVVLRVKRKREEDPVEALMVSKHAKVDPHSADGSDQSVFKFAGTVSSEAVSEALILEKVRGHSKLVKFNPLTKLSLEDTLQQRREQLKASRSEHRYKLVSRQRSLTSAESDSTPQGLEPSKHSTLCILDIEEDVHSEPHPPPIVGGATTITDHSQSEITCNNVTMMRERAGGSPGVAESAFVYDLYYTQDLTTHGMSTIDWGSVCIRECGVELVHDILDPDDHYDDDDDDSNDENNWRNDYPDEEDLSPAGSHSNSDNDLNEEYRYRDAYHDDDSFSGDYGDYYR